MNPVWILYFIILYSLPGMASTECVRVLADPIRSQVTAERIPQFRIDPLDPREDRISRDTLIRDFVTEKDQVILFRIINSEKYIKNFSKQVYKGEGGYSYSIDPGIALSWGGNEAILLVAIQNLTQDSLRYPGYPTGSKFDPVDYSLPLQKETRLGDIAFYDEVKVPSERENVVAMIPRSQMLEIFGADKSNPLGTPGLNYSVGATLEKIAHAPDCIVP